MKNSSSGCPAAAAARAGAELSSSIAEDGKAQSTYGFDFDFVPAQAGAI